ncbi:MAG: enoyl-CoA hydratase/isomerase family protein [Promethearchaeota archaeon]
MVEKFIKVIEDIESKFEHIKIRRDPENYVTTLTMNHPPLNPNDKRINTMGPGLVEELRFIPEIFRFDNETRVIIIKGSNNCFTSGADLTGSTDEESTPWLTKQYVSRMTRIFKSFRDLGKPVIAAIEGLLIGAGFELSLNCDLRYAKETASFTFSEILVGMFPGNAGTHLLARNIGLGRAMEMILTGKTISAKRAYEIGLVNDVFKDERFDKRVYKIAKTLAKSSAPIAMGIAKQIVNYSNSIPLDVGIELDAYGFGLVSSTEDYKEGIEAMWEGRPPKYKNK